MADPYAAPTIPQLIGLLEDGDLNAEMAEEYRALIARMEASAADTGGKTKVKGKMVVTIDLALQGGAYEITGALKVTAPKRAARRTLMYAAEDHSGLQRTRPNEPDMFLRDASSGAPKGATRIA